MKSLIFTSALLLSAQVFSTESINCKADKTIQLDSRNLKTDAKFSFIIEKNGNQSEIKNLQGHVYVKPEFDQDDTFNTENAYIGYFKIDQQTANPKYRPTKYKGWVQFKNIDAIETTGLEEGMWGSLVLNLSAPKKMEARYIFQAGDHMGGTVLFTCHSL